MYTKCSNSLCGARHCPASADTSRNPPLPASHSRHGKRSFLLCPDGRPPPAIAQRPSALLAFTPITLEEERRAMAHLHVLAYRHASRRLKIAAPRTYANRNRATTTRHSTSDMSVSVKIDHTISDNVRARQRNSVGRLSPHAPGARPAHHRESAYRPRRVLPHLAVRAAEPLPPGSPATARRVPRRVRPAFGRARERPGRSRMRGCPAAWHVVRGGRRSRPPWARRYAARHRAGAGPRRPRRCRGRLGRRPPR